MPTAPCNRIATSWRQAAQQSGRTHQCTDGASQRDRDIVAAGGAAAQSGLRACRRCLAVVSAAVRHNGSPPEYADDALWSRRRWHACLHMCVRVHSRRLLSVVAAAPRHLDCGSAADRVINPACGLAGGALQSDSGRHRRPAMRNRRCQEARTPPGPCAALAESIPIAHHVLTQVPCTDQSRSGPVAPTTPPLSPAHVLQGYQGPV